MAQKTIQPIGNRPNAAPIDRGAHGELGRHAVDDDRDDERRARDPHSAAIQAGLRSTPIRSSSTKIGSAASERREAKAVRQRR